MTIEITAIRPRGEDRQVVEFLLNGQPWSHGSVPVDLSEVEVQAWLEEHEDAMLVDYYITTYPGVVVIPKNNESLLQAWERILAAGIDDAENSFI